MTKEFKTQNLQLAVHLRLCGIELRDIEKIEDSKRLIFVFFDNEDKIEKSIQSFWNNAVLFSTSQVLSMLTETKKRMYDINN